MKTSTCFLHFSRKIRASTKTSKTIIASSSSAYLAFQYHSSRKVSCCEGKHEIDPLNSEIRDDFDLYIAKPLRRDLIDLYNANQNGKNVWPWIWTQHNSNGPHHVFVGKVTMEQIGKIKNLRQNVPNVNILVITDGESVKQLEGGVHCLNELECGLVIDTNVQITDHDNQMIMLEDERIICFTQLYKN